MGRRVFSRLLPKRTSKREGLCLDLVLRKKQLLYREPFVMVYIHYWGGCMKAHNYIPQKACVCINFRRIANTITELYDRALKPLGVSVNQYSLLVNTSRMEGCGTGELAQRVKLEKSTLVRTLRPLLRDGLIVDKSSDARRRRRLYLTPTGEEVLKNAFPLWSKAQEEVIAGIGMDYDELVALFLRIDSWE